MSEERTCVKHGIPLIEEPGGSDQPTIHGRTYCSKCQAEFVAALDKSERNNPNTNEA